MKYPFLNYILKSHKMFLKYKYSIHQTNFQIRFYTEHIKSISILYQHDNKGIYKTVNVDKEIRRDKIHILKKFF